MLLSLLSRIAVNVSACSCSKLLPMMEIVTSDLKKMEDKQRDVTFNGSGHRPVDQSDRGRTESILLFIEFSLVVFDSISDVFREVSTAVIVRHIEMCE